MKLPHSEHIKAAVLDSLFTQIIVTEMSSNGKYLSERCLRLQQALDSFFIALK